MKTNSHHQYIANWHDSFVNYIEKLLGVVARLMAKPEASEKDKNVLEAIKMILNDRDVKDVERDLAAGVVKKGTLDKIERLNKDLADTCLEHFQLVSHLTPQRLKMHTQPYISGTEIQMK